jgi:hypothetical protein
MEPVRKPARLLLNAVCLLISISRAHAQLTIAAIRHSEKPPTSLGKLHHLFSFAAIGMLSVH